MNYLAVNLINFKSYCSDNLLEAVIRMNLLSDDHRQDVKNALLLKHVHQHEKEFQKQISNNGEKKSFPLIRSLADMGKKISHVDFKESNQQQLPQIPSSNLLSTEQSASNLRQSSTQATLELGGSMAKIAKTDSKSKVFTMFLQC